MSKRQQRRIKHKKIRKRPRKSQLMEAKRDKHTEVLETDKRELKKSCSNMLQKLEFKPNS